MGWEMKGRRWMIVQVIKGRAGDEAQSKVRTRGWWMLGWGVILRMEDGGEHWR